MFEILRLHALPYQLQVATQTPLHTNNGSRTSLTHILETALKVDQGAC